MGVTGRLNLGEVKKKFFWRITKRRRCIVNMCTSIALLATTALGPGLGVTAPVGGQITSGAGTITQSGDATNIHQQTQRLDINWQSFNTFAHESVNFQQPGADSVAINRVIGGMPPTRRSSPASSWPS